MADTRIEAVAQDRSAGREFNFSLDHFKAISTRIYDFAGIRLTEAKREMVYARLARRLRSLGIDSFDNYIRYLELEPAEWEHCTNALTTNVTSFYREPHHFDTLAKHAAAADATQPYRVWSAGCSSGEEPYTIAMCLAESRPEGRFEVVASDLDTQVIAHGRDGVYPLESVMALTPERQKRFFLRGTGRNSGHARVRRELAAHVEFLRVNLMDDRWPDLGDFDAIFCRNVMIYFDKPTQRRLVERYAGLLRPHGLFFAGHAESLLDSGHRFRLRGQTVYELVPGGRGMNREDILNDEHPNRYFDPHFQIETAKILPGEYYATKEQMALVTVLGSCVSACLRDRDNGVGGMNHFMLPDEGKLMGSHGNVSAGGRYGVHAMELLINQILKFGGRRDRLEAKVFGGGNVLQGFMLSNVGEQNAEFIVEYLNQERIPIVARDLLDVWPRKIYYFPFNGKVMVRRLRKINNDTIVLRERDYGARLFHSPIEGGAELFK